MTVPPPPVDPAPGFSAAEWERFLSSHLGREVQVRYGHARRQVIVVHPERARLRVRMNRVFERAPQPVRVAVADWLRIGRDAQEACRALDDWIASIVTTLAPPRAPRLVLQGLHHDLEELTNDLLLSDFRHLEPERRPSGVTWGRRGRRGARRSLQLGSFDPETGLVRIHPVLDQSAVPRSFLRYVLFHEFLHAELNEPCQEGRRRLHHGREFRARERAHAGTAPALEWQERNLPALLRSARTGKPMAAPRACRIPRFLQPWLFDGPPASARQPMGPSTAVAQVPSTLPPSPSSIR